MFDLSSELRKISKMSDAGDPDSKEGRYNRALEKMKFDAEDIAVIELRRLTAQEPDFFPAWNLLGLAYIKIEDYDKAVECFEYVLRREKNAIKSLKYVNKMRDADENYKSLQFKELLNTIDGEFQSEKGDSVKKLKYNIKVPKPQKQVIKIKKDISFLKNILKFVQ